MSILMKKMTVTVLILFLCVCSGMESAAWADGEKHPIDAEVERRLEADYSTAGMLDAINYGYDEWDKLLNENYNALMKKLSKKQQEKLRASQREWIKFRDLEFEFNNEFFSDKGSMGRVSGASYASDFVKERALKLGNYLAECEM